MSGAYLNGGFGIIKSSGASDERIFYQNLAGSYGTMGSASPAVWRDVSGAISLSPGQTLSYAAGTVYSPGSSCNNSTISMEIGNAVIVFDN